MSLRSALMPFLARWFASDIRVKVRRGWHEGLRTLTRRRHTVTYYHRVDDPYCHLMVQILPAFAERFQVVLQPIVVEKLPAVMYPDPARYEALSRLDAARLALQHGLDFPANAETPDRLSVSMAARQLASLAGSSEFLPKAAAIGAAIWGQDATAVGALCRDAPLGDAPLRRGEQQLASAGYYASASLQYAGEIYQGLDRIDHLERRLNALGIGDGRVVFSRTQRWRGGSSDGQQPAGDLPVEMFFSVRSPYSYLALEMLADVRESLAHPLILRPVLPMMMRGMKVPAAKGRYIIEDVAREARLADIPFGKIADPLGRATERALALGLSLPPEDAFRFYRCFTRMVWAEGIDGATDKGLTHALVKAGLSADLLTGALPDTEWRAIVERNQQDLFRSGGWGVPTFRVGGQTFWGQDRIAAVLDMVRYRSAGAGKAGQDRQPNGA